MSNCWCSLYKNVQKTRRHWPLVCTDYWNCHPRHYYMPLTWHGSTSARNVAHKHSDTSNSYLATRTQPFQSKAFLNWIPKPWSVSLKVSNDYAALSAGRTWGSINCTLWQNYMVTKGSNKTSWHLQGTDEDPLTSNDVTYLFIYSWHYMLLLNIIISSRASDISLSSCHT